MFDLKAREAQLKARLSELEGRLHRIEDALDEAPNPDWEDNAIESANDDVLEKLGYAGSNEIEAIYAALARLKAGVYGICARCGEDISDERLDVLPHTPLCQTCAQEIARRKQ
jgi:RNA polymerase-binding transcription factor DksA